MPSGFLAPYDPIARRILPSSRSRPSPLPGSPTLLLIVVRPVAFSDESSASMRVSGDPTSPNPPTITVLPGPTSAAASSTEMTLLFTRPLDRLFARGTSTIAPPSPSPALRLPSCETSFHPLTPSILSAHDKYVQYSLLTD